MPFYSFLLSWNSFKYFLKNLLSRLFYHKISIYSTLLLSLTGTGTKRAQRSADLCRPYQFRLICDSVIPSMIAQSEVNLQRVRCLGPDRGAARAKAHINYKLPIAITIIPSMNYWSKRLQLLSGWWVGVGRRNVREEVGGGSRRGTRFVRWMCVALLTAVSTRYVVAIWRHCSHTYANFGRINVLRVLCGFVRDGTHIKTYVLFIKFDRRW